MADQLTADAVKEVLLEAFMKKRDGDVNTKAAQMIAIDMLHDGWKELERVHSQETKGQRQNVQVGV